MRSAWSGLAFRYDAERPLVLDDLSLTIAAGKVTAIVGSSGAGKSTVADLVNGLLSPVTGRVLVDGVELTPQAAQGLAPPRWLRSPGHGALSRHGARQPALGEPGCLGTGDERESRPGRRRVRL